MHQQQLRSAASSHILPPILTDQVYEYPPVPLTKRLYAWSMNKGEVDWDASIE